MSTEPIASTPEIAIAQGVEAVVDTCVDPVVSDAAQEFGAGQTEAPDTPYSQLAELASVLLKSIARAEARIQILEEKQKERDEWEQRVQNTPAPSVPATVNPVAPPTGLSAKNATNYKDSICDNCNQIHDGTGRVIDVRGKLVKNPNPCSNPQ